MAARTQRVTVLARVLQAALELLYCIPINMIVEFTRTIPNLLLAGVAAGVNGAGADKWEATALVNRSLDDVCSGVERYHEIYSSRDKNIVPVGTELIFCDVRSFTNSVGETGRGFRVCSCACFIPFATKSARRL